MRVPKKGRWAHINIKLLHSFFSLLPDYPFESLIKGMKAMQMTVLPMVVTLCTCLDFMTVRAEDCSPVILRDNSPDLTDHNTINDYGIGQGESSPPCNGQTVFRANELITHVWPRGVLFVSYICAIFLFVY